jgi:hypothetical protein
MRLVQFLVFLGAFSIGLKTVLPLYIYADFKLRQAEIAVAFCENLDKPELECNGQCHLKKEIAKAVESPNPNKAQTLPEPETLQWLTTARHYNLPEKLHAEIYATVGYSYQANWLAPALVVPEHPPCA